MSRLLKSLAALLALVAILALAGCQPSITAQLEAGLPEAPPRPTTMPNLVGKDTDAAATELMNSQVKVRVAVPERSVPASLTSKGVQIIAVYVKPETVDMSPSERRFTGFKVASQSPAAGAALVASETVLLTVGVHPKALAGSTWYSTHPADNKRFGNASCIDSGGGGTGCHVQSYCVSCHSGAIKHKKP
jgi:hypothetical protein